MDYRNICKHGLDHGIYLNGMIQPRCKHCDHKSYALSCSNDGRTLWTFCQNCNQHTAWIHVEPMPKPRTFFEKLVDFVSGTGE